MSQNVPPRPGTSHVEACRGKFEKDPLPGYADRGHWKEAPLDA